MSGVNVRGFGNKLFNCYFQNNRHGLNIVIYCSNTEFSHSLTDATMLYNFLNVLTATFIIHYNYFDTLLDFGCILLVDYTKVKCFQLQKHF